jgi:O-acetyl-ADP-ribose deacetylase (regulator of RNase III)
MEIYLVDIEIELVESWKKEFYNFPEINIICGDILSLAENTIVSPANSYGYMDGGIDKLYIDYFGSQLQGIVVDAILRRQEGLLPVGASLIVPTTHEKVPYMIVSPTMEIPGPVNSPNCYHAMAATLRTAANNSKYVKKLYCPGLCTGTGRVPFDEAAKEMALAYKRWKEQS